MTIVVAPEMTSVDTTVVFDKADETTGSEVAGPVVGEPAAEETICADEVGSGAGDDVDAGAAVVEGGDVVGCGSLGVVVVVGLGLGLGEDVADVDEVSEVVAAASLARAR